MTHDLESYLNFDKVCWNPVSPPELPGDAPVPHSVHPRVPGLLEHLGDDLEILGLDGGGGILGHLHALDVPLGLDQRLYDVLGPAAHGHHHGVVLDAAIETLLFQGLDDSLASVEALHPLKGQTEKLEF